MNNFVKNDLKVDDFNANDLFNPQPKRTKKILTKFLKFYKFKQDEKETYRIYKESLDASISTYKEALAKNEKLNKNLAKIKIDKENDRDNTEKINSEIEILTVRKEEMNAEVSELQVKLNHKTIELNDIDEKIVKIF